MAVFDKSRARDIGAGREPSDSDKTQVVTLTDNTGGTGTDTLADGFTQGAAFTDNTTGSASTTLAAGVGVSQIAFHLNLATISDADVVTTYTPGYKFKILALDFITGTPVTTAAKATTLNAEIGTTDLTGGTVSLTSANCTPLGAEVAGAAVTATNTGTASDTISIEATSTTAFAEGDGMLLITIQNMDTADAFASLAAQRDLARTDASTTNDNIASLGDKIEELRDVQVESGHAKD